jgi:hypothetical protein
MATLRMAKSQSVQLPQAKSQSVLLLLAELPQAK